MMVTGAFFADYSRSAEGKLDVMGGVWDWYPIASFDEPISAHLVVLMQAGPDDVGQPFHLTCEIHHANATEPIAHMRADAPAGPRGEQNAIGIPFSFTTEHAGRHVFLIRGNSGDPYSLALDIRLQASY